MWKFQLSALLDIRRTDERRCQLEVARALMAERTCLAAVAQLDATIDRQYRSWRERGHSVSVARETTFESRIANLQTQREGMQLELGNAAAAVVAAGGALEVAARARAALERLEQRSRTAHEARPTLIEALALDEFNVARRVRKL